MERVNQLQLVSYEIAKKLKEVGFNWKTYFFYEYRNQIEDWNEDFGNETVSAPTLALVQKWLREMYDLIVLIDHSYHPVKTRYAASLHTFEIKDIKDGFTWFDSYEQALEQGINEALKLIK